ncbi:MAG: hypothetical protein K2H70_06260, partial [Bacteroidales bacterium]|nr:hypothetical protein [Bacteroidales bacterium]
ADVDIVLTGTIGQAAPASTFGDNGRQTITALKDTLYILGIVNEHGCPISDTARIRVYPRPNLSLATDNICAGSESTVYAMTADTGLTYRWAIVDRAAAAADPTNPTAGHIHTYTGDTLRYTPSRDDSLLVVHLEVEQQSGCRHTFDTAFELFRMNGIAPLNDTLVCQNSTVRLFPTASQYSAVKGYSIQWFDSLANATKATNIYGQFAHTHSNSYYLAITHKATGCVYRDTVHVKVDSLPTTFLPDTLLTCTGMSVTFSFPDTAIRHYSLLEWTDKYTSTRINNRNKVNPTYNYGREANSLGQSVAYLFMKGKGACADARLNDSVVVLLNEFNLGISPTAVSTCSESGDTLSIVFRSPYRDEAESFYWLQDGIRITDSVIYRTSRHPDTTYGYTDTLVAMSKFGCERRQTVQMTFFRKPKINEPENDTICLGATINLSARCDAVPTRAPKMQWLELQADGSTTLLSEGRQILPVTPPKTPTYMT